MTVSTSIYAVAALVALTSCSNSAPLGFNKRLANVTPAAGLSINSSKG